MEETYNGDSKYQKGSGTMLILINVHFKTNSIIRDRAYKND